MNLYLCTLSILFGVLAANDSPSQTQAVSSLWSPIKKLQQWISMPVNSLEGTDGDDKEEEQDCSLQNIDDAKTNYTGGQCEFTRKFCEPQSIFNFLELYYCAFQQTFGDVGKILVFIPCGALFMFIGMYTLSSTADVYLSPALETMTTKFGLSDSLAGVTLLAFGNGAPDVFSSISAAQDSNSDGKLDAVKSISIVLGGTFFITSVVMFLSVRAANMNEDPNGPPLRQIKVTPRYFIRDVVFYMITCIYLLIVLFFFGGFNVFLAIGLLLIYAIYVVVVVIQSKTGNKVQEEEAEADIKANKFHEMITFQKKASHRMIENDEIDQIANEVQRQMTKQKTRRMKKEEGGDTAAEINQVTTQGSKYSIQEDEDEIPNTSNQFDLS